MTAYLEQLLNSLNASLSETKSDWNNGEINLPVYYTEAIYFYKNWEIRVLNEDRDMVYKDNDYVQQQVVNLWNIKASSPKLNSDYTFSIEKATWIARKIFHRPKLRCVCTVPRYRDVLINNPTIARLFSYSFVNFCIKGEVNTSVFEITTSFNINKFTEKKVELALEIIEEVINVLDKN